MALSLALPAEAECPPAAEAGARIAALEAEGTFAPARFHGEFPSALRKEALAGSGRPIVVRQDKVGFGVISVEMPVERLWKALNDEDHYDLEGRFIPVDRSEVIEGAPAGRSRLLFQTFQRWGIGRWWVSRVEMNRALFDKSGGELLELTWRDEIDTFDRTRAPVAEIAEQVRPFARSRGSWLLIPLAEDCTLIEYTTDSDPGGMISGAQFLVAKKAVRDTLAGLVRLAEEHIGEDHPGVVFVRPDGSRLP